MIDYRSRKPVNMLLDTDESMSQSSEEVDKLRVAALARVSTLHEAQVNALKNQAQWLCKLIEQHKNWIFDPEKDLYVDEGKSGTSMEHRDGLLAMLEKAEQGYYDLIIIREVSRLMRHVRQALEIIESLKAKGVEIYFAAENISTFENSRTFEMIIRAGLAQQESEKIGGRVKNGIQISNSRGKITSGINTFGYDYIQKPVYENGSMTMSGMLVKNDREAEIVKRIFDMYVNGISQKNIARILNSEGVLGKNGKINWDASIVGRILHRKTYIGVLEYGKTYTSDSISHNRIKAKAGETKEVESRYIETIITKDIWDKAQEICKSKTNKNLGRCRGSRLSKDIYSQLMRCECGRRFRMDKGREDGMATYKCYNIVNNGSLKVRKKTGLSLDDVCTLPGIIDWKLDLYTKKVFEYLSVSLELVKDNLRNYIERYYVDDAETQNKDKQIKKVKSKLNSIDNCIYNTVTRITEDNKYAHFFMSKLDEYSEEKEKLELQLRELEQIEEDRGKKEECLRKVDEFLIENLKFVDDKVPDVFLKTYVNHIKVYNSNTFEYNINMGVTKGVSSLIDHNKEYMIHKGDSIYKIDNSDAKVLAEFRVEYDEAKSYANSKGRKAIKTRWKPAIIRIVANI